MAEFGKLHIDEILFYLTNGLAGGNTKAIFNSILTHGIISLMLTLLFIFPLINFKFNPISQNLHLRYLYAIVLFIATISQLFNLFNVPSFIRSIFNQSTIYEKYYIAPQTVSLTFPEKKRNLIYIFMESMENTVLSEKNGGVMSQSLIPELENIALHNINFSNKNNGLAGGESTCRNSLDSGRYDSANCRNTFKHRGNSKKRWSTT